MKNRKIALNQDTHSIDMNQEELVCIVAWQFGAVAVAALFVWVLFGATAAISSVVGGLCVAVPNGLFALRLFVGLAMRRPVQPTTLIVSMFFKMFSACILIVVAAKFFSDINWPAMLFGLIAAVSSQFFLIFVKR